MRAAHHETGPSTWPALLECACYQSKGDDEYTGKGQQMHDYTEAIVAGIELPDCPDLDDADKADCEWAADYIIDLFKEKGVDQKDIEIERQMDLFDTELNLISFGTQDFGALNIVVDLKSCFDYEIENKNNRPQIAGYALMRMQKHPQYREIQCVEVYIKPRKVVEYTAPYGWCVAIADQVISRCRDEEKHPQPCNYCHLCSRVARCPAIVRTVEMIRDVYSDFPKEAIVPDPKNKLDVIAKSFITAKRVIKPWIDAIERIALETAAEGKNIPYTELKSKTGKKTITDHELALGILGLDASDYLKAVTVSIPKLATEYARKNGMLTKNGNLNIKVAQKHIEGILHSVINVDAPAQYLSPILSKTKA